MSRVPVVKNLGPADAIRFIQNYSHGNRDYTKERKTWLEEDLDAVVAGILERRKKEDSALSFLPALRRDGGCGPPTEQPYPPAKTTTRRTGVYVPREVGVSYSSAYHSREALRDTNPADDQVFLRRNPPSLLLQRFHVPFNRFPDISQRLLDRLPLGVAPRKRRDFCPEPAFPGSPDHNRKLHF